MSINKDEMIFAGKLGKAHGLKGELKIYPEDVFEEDLLQMDFLLLQTANQMLPYFIESVRGEGFLIVKFEGCDNRSQAIELEKKDFYFKKDLLLYPIDEYSKEEESEYGFLIDFDVLDTEGKKLGVITTIEEYPQQIMATVLSGEKPFLIPLVKSFIIDINTEKKTIELDLPEGILEL